MRRDRLRDETGRASRPRIGAAGFGLVEMLIAVAAGLVLSTAVIAFMLSSMRSNGEYVQSARLSQELRNTLDLVTRDLSRAGYNDSALSLDSLPVASPFAPVFVKDASPTVTAGLASTYPNADGDGCILYAYDRTFPLGYETNGSCDALAGCGSPGELDEANGEVRGIRRSCMDGACDGEADDIGVIEYAESSAGVVPACDGGGPDYSVNPATCNDASGWCPLSDPRLLNITRFMVVNTGSDLSNVMRIRDYGIHLEGSLLRDNGYSRAVATEVKVRADCINPLISNCASAPSP